MYMFAAQIFLFSQGLIRYVKGKNIIYYFKLYCSIIYKIIYVLVTFCLPCVQLYIYRNNN